MRFSNLFIIQKYDQLKQLSKWDIILPIKISFFLSKNIKLLEQVYFEVEEAKIKLGQLYGDVDDLKSSYIIKPEYREHVNQELGHLLEIEQDLNLHIFKLSEFDDIELTYEQFEAISFMIEE